MRSLWLEFIFYMEMMIRIYLYAGFLQRATMGQTPLKLLKKPLFSGQRLNFG
ncbi:hypothetical protein [Acinetobacter indicus]|uniref:hypothetical protein n=1 Tax=Acinetobacter indicus TaxID=756892 RepID=UPI00144404A4|nr:hypothetical protein [Acinetobacter indicus]